MKKRLVSLLLCVCLVISSVAIYGIAAEEEITLKYYDDRMDVSGREVRILDAGTPTSYKVGYGVADGTRDSAVITLENGKLIATGVGNARISLDGKEYDVCIEPAPLALFLLMGQSNMEGDDGNEEQSIANEEGQVYSTYGFWLDMKRGTSWQFVPSALQGEGSLVNTRGTTEGIETHPVNRLTESGDGKKGIDSALAYEWNKLTGKKVWVVNTSATGTAQYEWAYNNGHYNRTKDVLQCVFSTLQKEIMAGHYVFDRMGYFWCQGCSDSYVSAESYATEFLKMDESIRKEFTFDHDGDEATTAKTFEFANILTIRAATIFGGEGYRRGEYKDTTELIEPISFTDLQMTGPRVAMYWLGNNPDYPHINVVSNITERWVYMPDGSDGVKKYFEANYEGGRVDYPTQTPQTEDWRTPETPYDVHPHVHYSQIGYNELGRDAMRNTCYLLGEVPLPEYEASVRLLAWDGYTEYGGNITPDISANSLAVPVAEPLFLSKSISVEIPEQSSYTYYDLTGIYGGKIRASVEDAEALAMLEDKQPVKYSWELSDNELSSVTDNGEILNPLVNSDSLPATDGVFPGTRYSMDRKVVLRHDMPWSVEWKSAGGEYMLFSATENAYTEGNLYVHVSKSNNGVSVGQRINKDGKLQYDSYGVNLADYGLSVSDTHVYRIANEVQGSSNYLWLYVDGEKTAQLTAHNLIGVWDGTSGAFGNGQDFVFSYIGAKPYALRNVALEYLYVNEGIEEKPEATVGDVDGDGEITMLDLFRLKLFMKQKAIPTPVEIVAGDIDGDGEITMVDSFEMKYRVSKGYWRS